VERSHETNIFGGQKKNNRRSEERGKGGGLKKATDCEMTRVQVENLTKAIIQSIRLRVGCPGGAEKRLEGGGRLRSGGDDRSVV